MESNRTGRSAASDSEETRRRLTSEVAEIEGAIEMVASGNASRVTVAGLKFGEQLAQRFQAEAASKGVTLDPIPFPEDAGCDLIVRRIDE
jgi:hypothetical protein